MALQPLPAQASPVAIATCAAVAGVETEDLQVIEALTRRSINAVHAVWNDPAVDWSSFPLVVIRSTWDYPDHHRAFLAWAGQLRRVLNPLPILRWNTDKRYLNDLGSAGLPVIPTHFLTTKDVFEPPSSPFVVKPAVSYGAKDTARYDARNIAQARDHVRRLQARGQDCPGPAGRHLRAPRHLPAPAGARPRTAGGGLAFRVDRGAPGRRGILITQGGQALHRGPDPATRLPLSFAAASSAVVGRWPAAALPGGADDQTGRRTGDPDPDVDGLVRTGGGGWRPARWTRPTRGGRTRKRRLGCGNLPEAGPAG
jgi:hypothetical protein